MRIISMDGSDGPSNDFQDPRHADPARAFDLEWGMIVVEHALERVRGHFKSRGREAHFEVFQKYALAAEEAHPTYAELASQLGMKETEVTRHLAEVRSEIRSEVRAELSRTILDGGDVEEEWRVLFGS